MRARALYDFVADAANGELSFREGDIIDVTNTVRALQHALQCSEARERGGGRGRSLRVRSCVRACVRVCVCVRVALERRTIRRAATDGGKESWDPRRESFRKTTSR